LFKRCYIFLFCLICSTNLFSQFAVKNFYSFSGKKDLAVNVICQDVHGFLFIGTKEGVFRFDGLIATNLTNDFPVIKKEITALFADSQNRIWIGTKQGKVYIIKGNILDSLTLNKPEIKAKVTSFCEINSGLCIGTYGNGVYAYKNGILKHFNTRNGLTDNYVYSICNDNRNNVWCGTDAGITCIASIFSKPHVQVISDKNGLPDNIVRNIYLDGDNLLLAMQDSGVCYYDLKQKTIKRNPFFSSWAWGTVLNVCYQKQGKLLIATEKKGIIQIENGSVALNNYDEQILAGSINMMFLDRESQIWLASKRGISRLNEKRYGFINLSESIPDNKVLALVADNDNNIWLGTTAGIFKMMTQQDGKHLIRKVKDLSHSTISCAAKDREGNICFGTYGHGVICMRSDGKSTFTISTKDNQLPNNNISNIFFSADNECFVSTLGGGLVKARLNSEIKTKGFDVVERYTEAEGLGSNYVYAAITDKDGKIYVASDGGGLQVLDQGRFINLTNQFGFNSSTVYSLTKDKYNNIWATSNSEGILKYDGLTLQSIGLTHGLRDIQPQQIIAIGNTLYAFNAKGIDKINCENHSLSFYDILDGEFDPNLNSVFFHKGFIYSGTNQGILKFRTVVELADTVKPIVLLNDFQVNYKRCSTDSALQLRYSQNNLTFGYKGICLKNPDKLKYRYKLSGLEALWNYSDDGKLVNYNNLSPGDYSFIVQVKNEEDLWSAPAGHTFTILTPLWQRLWFWIFFFITGTIAVYTFIRYRLRNLQRENQLLEARVSERTYYVEKQSKIIEEKNKELEQLSLVASKTDNVVLIFDEQCNLEYVNESFMKLNNLSAEKASKLYGKSLLELSNNPNIKEIVNDALNNKRSVKYESLFAKEGNGKGIWESSTLTPLFDEANKLKKIIIIDTDVTQGKRQEQIILQKNKDITDSISYARKIQHAILPQEQLIKSYFPESFNLYLTKDIVSGDFYWFTHTDGISIIAAVDCTGHGVPGAFMSLIGYNQLNRIVNEIKITDPGEILFELNKGVLGILHKHESESKDGMDIAICRVDHNSGTIDFAGAMRPLWIVNNNVLTEIKADKIPIGTLQKDRGETIAFTTRRIVKKPGDVFYIFTDGFADQFGGEKDKKYSTKKLKQLLTANHSFGFDVQLENIKAEHLNWKGRTEQVDDILMIGFTF
jgi:PAS domain S-box-containing protein